MLPKSTRLRELFSSDGFATTVVAAASFTDTFMYDVAVPFLPQMLKSRLGMNPDQTQRFTSTALAVFGGAQLITNGIAAFATDRVKSKQAPFFLGLVFLIASVLMFFLGKHIAVILASRVFQGMSAAFVWVSGLSLLTSHVETSYLGFAMGMVTFGMAMGELIGPVSGGLLYEHAGHYAVMGLALGLLVTDIILRLLLQDKPSKIDRASDQERRPLLAGDGSAEGPNQPGNGSIDSEHNSHQQQKSRRTAIKDIACSWWAVLVTAMIRAMLEATAPLFVEREYGWSTSASGGIMFALLSPAVLSPWIGQYAVKTGPRWASVICFAINCGGFVGLAFLQRRETAVKTVFVILVAIIGICGSIMTTTHTVAFSVTAKKSEMDKSEGKKSQAGKSFGSMTVAWALAEMVGPLLADLFLETVGWHGMCFFLAAMCLVTSLLTFISWQEWEVLD